MSTLPLNPSDSVTAQLNNSPHAIPALKVDAQINVVAKEKQLITFANIPTEGSLILSFKGVSAAGILFSVINAANVQAALRLLTGLEAVLVTGSVGAGLLVDFVGYVGNAPMLVNASTTLKYNSAAEAYNITSLSAGAAYNVSHLTPKFISIYNGLNQRLNIMPWPTDATDPLAPVSGQAGTDIKCDILIADTAVQIATKLKLLLNNALVGGLEGFVASVLGAVVNVSNISLGIATDLDTTGITGSMSAVKTVEGAVAISAPVIVEINKGRGV